MFFKNLVLGAHNLFCSVYLYASWLQMSAD